MKRTIIALTATLALSANADEALQSTNDEIQSTIDEYTTRIKPIEYKLDKIGEHCTVVVTDESKDQTAMNTYNCQRLVAASVADRSAVVQLAVLHDQLIKGELTPEAYAFKTHILLRLRAATQLLNDEHYGAMK